MAYEDIGDGGPGTDHSVWHSVLFSCPAKDNSSGEAKKKRIKKFSYKIQPLL